MKRVEQIAANQLHLQKDEARIKLHKPLPVDLINPQAGEHLYMIGCAYYKRDLETERYRFHRPIIFLSIIAFIFTRTVVILLLPSKYDDWLIWLGDVSLVLKLKVHFNLLLMTFDYIIVFLHVLHFGVLRKYRKNGIGPNNSPFDLAAGLITPRSVGLYNKRKVLLFARFCKWSISSCLYMTRLPMNFVVWSAFFLAFIVKMVTMDSVAIWFVCLGHSIVWMFKSHIFFTYFFFHMLHFYIICFYLRLKMDTIQSALDKLRESNHILPQETNSGRILVLLGALRNVFGEIREFNSSFWSRFIFCVWSSYSINISMFLYSAIFSKVDYLIRGIIWLVSIIEIISVVALCWIASSVNKKAKIMYLSLNSLAPRLGTLNMRTKYKFYHYIEIWSSKRIGFTCWTLFMMNYFTFYEMVAIVATFFLKLVQMEYDE